jgi:FixJ family two-component response regulator
MLNETEALGYAGDPVSRRRPKAINTSTRSQRDNDAPDCTVYLIDHDGSLQPDLQRLLKSVALHSVVFKSPSEFLASARLEVPSCLILDIRLPGLSGLDFQLQLAREGIPLPLIFVTGYGDVSTTVRAMKAGAVDFLTKPCRDQDLLDAITAAIERDRNRRRDLAAMRALQKRFTELTDRQREVMSYVTSGLLNKQIAARLGLSEVTVKAHRGLLMRKLQARSLPDLVRMADLMRNYSPIFGVSDPLAFTGT